MMMAYLVIAIIAIILINLIYIQYRKIFGYRFTNWVASEGGEFEVLLKIFYFAPLMIVVIVIISPIFLLWYTVSLPYRIWSDGLSAAILYGRRCNDCNKWQWRGDCCNCNSSDY